MAVKKTKPKKAAGHALIVKRRGHAEKFDEKKLYASVYFACKTVELDHAKCEMISKKVLGKVKGEMKRKKSVSSDDIFKTAGIELERHDKNAAFMYLTHRDLS